jgi:geranylgeranyl diphosphate synthase, type II
MPDRTNSAKIEQIIRALVPSGPVSLYDPVRYLLDGGGKRARPMLTVLCAEVAGSHESQDIQHNAILAGAAVELLHNFTLVHDDIMDHAASRRGRPTLHTKFGVSEAILSGDVLVALANEALAQVQSPMKAEMLREFAFGFRAVCEGQALDTDFELQPSVSIDQYLHMIDMKTAKIFELAAVLGSLATDGVYKEELRAYAHHLGLAFQIADDLLDLTAEEAVFGKTIGGDILEGKRTFLYAALCEKEDKLNGSDRELLERIREHRTTSDDIALARNVMERLGILHLARERSAMETEQAERAIAMLPESEALTELRAFGHKLLRRDR